MAMVTVLRHLNDSDSSPFYKELQAGMADGSLHNLVTTARAKDGELPKRIAALEALATESMPCFISDLLVALAKDDDEVPAVRKAAIKALSFVQSRPSIAKLLTELSDRVVGESQSGRQAA